MEQQPMERNLIRIGDEYAVEIDQTMLDLLRITPETLVEMTVEGDTIIVTPVREAARTDAMQPIEKVDESPRDHTDTP
jgi:antitoxin component of MazEF toxin-antitoxin module